MFFTVNITQLLFLMCAFIHTDKSIQPRVSSLKDNYPSLSRHRKDEERKK